MKDYIEIQDYNEMKILVSNYPLMATTKFR